VPVNWPSTRAATCVLAPWASEVGKKLLERRCPVAWLNGRLTALLSATGVVARTQAVHCESDGSGAPGSSVPRWADAPGAAVVAPGGVAASALAGAWLGAADGLGAARHGVGSRSAVGSVPAISPLSEASAARPLVSREDVHGH